MSAPWQKFRVGKPSTRSNWTNPDCQLLPTVSHVAHVPAAVRIIEDGRLRADLVYDKSILNTERIRVVWFSPNDWYGAGGFRYGNVRFTFDWASLITSKNYYWVESIAYGVKACRILVTDEDRSGSLTPYDPTTGDGPWWQDANGAHHWNGHHCLEIMFEGDVPIADAIETDFVQHHPTYCNIDHRTCRFRGTSRYAAAAEFIGRLASQSVSLSSIPGLVDRSGAHPIPSTATAGGVSVLLPRCRASWTRPGALSSDAAAASAVARALLGAIACKSSDDAAELASLFRSAEDAEAAAAAALASLLGLEAPTHLYEI